jgi:hypothetical protein
MYFEDKPPEKCINDDDTRVSWMRTVGFDDVGYRSWVYANGTQVLIIVPTIFIDEFLGQKSIDVIEEARLASLSFGVEHDATAEASGQNVDTIQETIYTPSDEVSAQVSDQNADIIQDPNTSHFSSEESIECEDEEAMIEAAHELQSQLAAALPGSPQPPMREEQEEVIEVHDEHGETILIPASAFDEIEEDEEVGGEEEVNYSANDENRARKRRRSESSGHDNKSLPQGKERWRLEQIGWNNWVRTSYRYFGP